MSDDLFTRAFPNNRVDDEHQAGVYGLLSYALQYIGGNMATIEDLDNLTKKLADEFQFAYAHIAETCTNLFHPNSGNEVARLELLTVRNDQNFELSKIIGLSFQVEVINTDAILIFAKAKNFFQPVQLLPAFYQAHDGKIHQGLEAYVMCENDKEAQTRIRAVQELKMQQVEEWEISRLEALGKLRVH